VRVSLSSLFRSAAAGGKRLQKSLAIAVTTPDYTAVWALWAALVFCFFAERVESFPNYILPILPALAVLAGVHVC